MKCLHRLYAWRHSRCLLLAACIVIPPGCAALQINAEGEVQIPAMELPYSILASAQAKQRLLDKTHAPLPVGYSIAALRHFYGSYNDALAARMRTVFTVREKRETWDAVPVLRVLPANGAESQRVLINLHGGAFMWGNRSGEDVEAIPVAAISGIQIVSVDYRLAPEHPYPAALDDVEKVYRRLLRSHSPGSIGIYGCSSGAILASEAIARFATEDLPLPGAIGVSCGAMLPFEGDSTYFAPRSMDELPADGKPSRMQANTYFQDANVESPAVFPGLSDDVLRRFPPTLLLTGTRDQALSSSIRSEIALHRAGVFTEMHIWDGMWHAFFVDPDIPESREAYGFIADFFRSHLEAGGHAKRGE